MTVGTKDNAPRCGPLRAGLAAVSTLSFLLVAIGAPPVAEGSTAGPERWEIALDAAAERIERGEPFVAYRAAREVLEHAADAYPRRRAHDLAGYAARVASDNEGAAEHFRLAEQLVGVIGGIDPAGPWRAVWHAEALLALGRPDAALTRVEPIAAEPPRFRVHHRARVLRAQARLASSDNPSEAIRAARDVLDRYPEYPRWEALVLELSRVELEAGETRAAQRRLESLIDERPHRVEAAQARELLRSFGVSPTRSLSERLELARHHRYLRLWSIAMEELLALLRDAESGSASTSFVRSVRIELAKTAYDAGDMVEALSWFESVESTLTSPTLDREIVRLGARIRSRIGQQDEAWRALVEHYERRPRRVESAALAEWAYDLGRWDDALHYRDLSEGRDHRTTFDGGFLLYLAGRYDDAETALGSIVERSRGQSRLRAMYWLARTLGRAGRSGEALALFDELERDDPHGYYGVQAANRAVELRLDESTSARPGRYHWRGRTDDRLADLHAVVGAGGWDALFETSDPGAVRYGVREFSVEHGDLFPEARAAAALAAIGAHEDARSVLRVAANELRELDTQWSRGRISSVRRPIAIELEVGAHQIDRRRSPRGWWGVSLDESLRPVPRGRQARSGFVLRQERMRVRRDDIVADLRAALRSLDDAYMLRRAVYDWGPRPRGESLDETPDIWRTIYPRAYPALVRRAAETHQMNPYILWGIMLVESGFNPDAISHANAYGLMQVIPRTGELTALHMGEASFGIHDLLLPANSVRFGSWYLAQLLEKFRGQELLAFVAYNAGPHQVARWLDWRGEAMALDEFIETVPYAGARRYPQKVTSYLAHYRELYHGQRGLYIGNQLDASYEDNIYF